jgi:N-acetylglucosamine-6-phosphate deacetylase
MMLVLAGADLVLPDRVLPGGSLLIDGDRIVAIEPRVVDAGGGTRIDASGCTIVPGFIDVHVHGVEGHDVLDGPPAIAEVASRLPRYGVTAFCPTSVACSDSVLEAMLTSVRETRRPTPGSARVLSAHLESNFINPAYKGAQPLSCLRTPAANASPPVGDFASADILAVMARHREDIGIVTLAPEIDGGMALVRDLAAAGHLVSIGHTGATYEQALAAIDAGVTHATHLFNRMTPMTHRAPGVPGAVLQSDRVAAELICDGFHVHPALMQLAIRVKGVDRVLAITDGTAGSGLPVGSRTRLGGQEITVTERTAELADGTLAGSVLTMDMAFRALVRRVGVSLVEAARLCATTPAAQLRLPHVGRLEVGYLADLAVLDGNLAVRDTYVSGVRWGNTSRSAFV